MTTFDWWQVAGDALIALALLFHWHPIQWRYRR